MNISERTERMVEINNKYREMMDLVFIFAEEVEWPAVENVAGDGEAELSGLNEHMKKMLNAIIGASVVADCGDRTEEEKLPVREDREAA